MQSNQRGGIASIQLVDWGGDELLYSFGEAHMGNASSVVRWRGDDIVTASTHEVFFSDDGKNDAHVAGSLQLLGGAYNSSGALYYSDDFNSMLVKGSLNDMAVLASYDVRSNDRGSSAAVQFVDWSGDEMFFSRAVVNVDSEFSFQFRFREVERVAQTA